MPTDIAARRSDLYVQQIGSTVLALRVEVHFLGLKASGCGEGLER